MHSMVLKEPHDFQWITKDVPVPRQGEALIRIRRIGICGTDYHAFHGRQPYFDYPRILGHELAGEVVQLPSGELQFKVGDQVSIIPYLECGQCYACRHGRPNACEKLTVMGVHIDGGLQEYIAVPVEKLVSTKGLSLDQSVIIEPLAIGAHAVNRADIKPGNQVLVIGAGPIGLAAMIFAKLAGAYVIALDLNEYRLEFAKRWANCDHTVSALTDVQKALSTITNGEMPSIVFDATGNIRSMEQAFQYASHAGKVVYLSLVQGNISFSDPYFHKKELTLCASRSAKKEEFVQVIEAIQAGHVDADMFITHRSEFRQAVEAVLSWIKPENAVIKGVLEL